MEQKLEEMSKNWCIPREVDLFAWNSKRYRSIRHWNFCKFKSIFLSVESAPGQIFHFLTGVCCQVTLSVVARLFRKMEPSIPSLSVAVITVNSGFTCKQGERVHFCFVLTFSPRSKQKNIDRRLNYSNIY